MASILVVAAHPDDEALGCGGTIARHVAAGDEVACLFLADGATSRESEADASVRERQARRAADTLGIGEILLARFPDNRMDTVALLDVVQVIEKVVARFSPETIYTHHGGDLNIDHRITHQAVLTACRPQPGHSVRAIYGFEVPSSTEWAPPATLPPFTPTRFVDITAYLEQKRAALDCYVEEMRPWPHARSFEAVEALARMRGACVGVEAAEAFMVIREIAR